VSISLHMKLVINKFLYKNIVPMLYKYVGFYIKHLNYIYVI